MLIFLHIIIPKKIMCICITKLLHIIIVPTKDSLFFTKNYIHMFIRKQRINIIN